MENNKNKFKKSKKFLGITIFAILAIYIVIGFSQTKLIISKYVYCNIKVPKAFDGYKIIIISDLHHKNFGNNQSELIKAVKASNPDLILLTGDIVDKNHTDMESIEDLLKGIEGVAPAYYVTGNHEMDMGAKNQYEELKRLLKNYGVTDLNDSDIFIERENDVIHLYGKSYLSKNISEKLEVCDDEKFSILMYHCSDSFDKISNHGYDIIMSGHTHGGIVRLPIVGGVFGNSRRLFPKYDGGIFVENNCTLISSRGLGDAIIPRFYNPPELVVVTLKCE